MLFRSALLLAGGSLIKAKMSEQKAADNVKSAINKRKGCGCGSKSFNARSMNDPIAEDQDRQNCVSNGCEWVEADPMSRSTSYCKCHNATAKEGGIQNSLDGGVTFQSEFSVGQINPVEVYTNRQKGPFHKVLRFQLYRKRQSTLHCSFLIQNQNYLLIDLHGLLIGLSVRKG